jgi:phospholipid/cholesterol/gamma-HCH transport system permease protein
MPCLAIWSDLMGILGGALFGVAGADFTFGSYLIATREALAPRDITTGMAKTLFRNRHYRCRLPRGLFDGRRRRGVGRSTTSAVVISILLVVLIDLTFTYLFYSARTAI